ncbi:MAG: CHASE2 domain-containing protein [Thermaceae bacterium]|nr:CHASE2 domain-containing protein [Thermaceae bacterium]
MSTPMPPNRKSHLKALGHRLRKEFIAEQQQSLPWWALLAGLVLFMGLGLLRSTPYIRALENEGIDRVMQWSRPYGLEKQNPVALVEINQETYTRWGEPTRLPHDRLAAVLVGVARYHPRAIVFDFDLAAARLDTPRAQGLYTYLGTERLQQVLREYGWGQGQDYPPLVLMRTFRHTTLTCVRYSRLLDDPQIAANPHVAFAAPTFVSEGVVRFWQFSTQRSDLKSCGQVSAGVLPSLPSELPSVQLLLLWLEQGLPAAALYEKLKSCQQGADCSLRLAGHPLDLSGKGDQGQQRVIYSLPWDSGGAVRYPAYALENPQSYTAWPPLEALQNQVVFVGSTFQPSADWYRTALGNMPGVWVLVNAYYSLRDSGQLRPLGWGWRLLLGGVLLGIYALLRHWLKLAWTRKLMGYTLLVVAVYVGTLFSQQALWVDVVLMLFTLQIVERVVGWVASRQKALEAKKQEAVA